MLEVKEPSSETLSDSTDEPTHVDRGDDCVLSAHAGEVQLICRARASMSISGSAEHPVHLRAVLLLAFFVEAMPAELEELLGRRIAERLMTIVGPARVAGGPQTGTLESPPPL
jgi:hypothetical protein